MRIQKTVYAALLIAGLSSATYAASSDTNTMTNENVMKTVLLSSYVVTGVAGFSFAAVAFSMKPNIDRMYSMYYTSRDTFPGRWQEYTSMVGLANAYYAAGFACAVLAAGQFVWWLLTPDNVPSAAVTLAPLSRDGILLSFAMPF
ncbi:MAG: hypothetical protein HZC28_19670 [Spirochaetes bacterium]|nr:hypothetical protein [Spirochaetota bacterium]